MRLTKNEKNIQELLLIGTSGLCENTKDRFLTINLDHNDRVKEYNLTFKGKIGHEQIEIEYSFETNMYYLYYYFNKTMFICKPCNCMGKVVEAITNYESEE